jgi:cellobiose phosphorylase
VGISQYILGVHPEFEGLRINPVVPKDWKEFSITRKFRDVTYKIEFKRGHDLQGIYRDKLFVSKDFIKYDTKKLMQKYICYYK